MSVSHEGHSVLYTGTGTNDNDVIFTTGDVSAFNEFTLMSTAGAMDVLVSVDGTNFTTAPLSLADLGATTTAPVLVTAANRAYAFAGTFAKIRVLQNGATAVTAGVLRCAKVGRG